MATFGVVPLAALTEACVRTVHEPPLPDSLFRESETWALGIWGQRFGLGSFVCGNAAIWLVTFNSVFSHPVQEGRAGDAEDLGRLNFIPLLHF